MTRAVVTGARGFIGRHLILSLREAGVLVSEIGRDDPWEAVETALLDADVVYHLAGANRPRDDGEFTRTNVEFTRRIADVLRSREGVAVVFTSSIHATSDSPYGRSKLAAEELLAECLRDTSDVRIYRLPGVFGPGCRPYYNSVVATFCARAAAGLELEIREPGAQLRLVHVADVVRSLAGEPQKVTPGCSFRDVAPVFDTTLGDLAARITALAATRRTLTIPDLGDPFNFRLYGTFLSYLDEADISYPLERRSDDRGTLAELLKSRAAGQLFLSRTRPGAERGHHWHRMKAEKFVVVEGSASISFRRVPDGPMFSVDVRGDEFRVVDIPPGYAHSLVNSGDGDLVVLFWASEIFDPAAADTSVWRATA